MNRVCTTSLLLVGVIVPTVEAQEEEDLVRVFTADPTLDKIFQHGDDVVEDRTFNQFRETIALYEAGHPGATIPISNPVTLHLSDDDTIYVGDADEQIILAINDHNEDGDAYDLSPVEHYVFFDGTPGGNASGIELPYITNIAVPVGQIVWASVAETATGAGGFIVRFEDLNGDLDANDAGEAEIWWTAPSDSWPRALDIGADGNVYYVENSAAVGKGVWKLEDLNGNQQIDPGEVSSFFAPAGAGELVALEQEGEPEESGTPDGWFLLDSSNRFIWRLVDIDSSGTIEPLEAFTWWTLDPAQEVYDLAVVPDGDVYTNQSTPSHMTRLLFAADEDGSGIVEPAETEEVYDDTISPEDVATPNGLATDFHGHGDLGEVFCVGGNMCPCGNPGGSDQGCANSTGGGTHIEAEGSDSVGNDDMIFIGEDLPPLRLSFLLMSPQGSNIPFKDGVLCLANPIKRLVGGQSDADGEVVFGPGLGQVGGWSPGQTRYFQIWYRDLQGPCGSGSNLTPGLRIKFTP